MLNLDYGFTLDINGTSDLRSLRDIIIDADDIYIETIVAHRGVLLSLFINQDQIHILDSTSRSLVPPNVLSELFRFHPQMPDQYLILLAIHNGLWREIGDTVCVEADTSGAIPNAHSGVNILRLDPAKSKTDTIGSGNPLMCNTFDSFTALVLRNQYFYRDITGFGYRPDRKIKVPSIAIA